MQISIQGILTQPPKNEPIYIILSSIVESNYNRNEWNSSNLVQNCLSWQT